MGAASKMGSLDCLARGGRRRTSKLLWRVACGADLAAMASTRGDEDAGADEPSEILGHGPFAGQPDVLTSGSAHVGPRTSRRTHTAHGRRQRTLYRHNPQQTPGHTCSLKNTMRTRFRDGKAL